MKASTEQSLEVRLLLDVILGLMQQYMPHEGNNFPHQMMAAGEDTSDALMHYGLGDDDGYAIILDEKKVNAVQDSVAGKSFKDLER